MLQGQPWLALLDIPELDCIIARGASENIGRGRVEEDMADLSRVTTQPPDGRNVSGVLCIGV